MEQGDALKESTTEACDAPPVHLSAEEGTDAAADAQPTSDEPIEVLPPPPALPDAGAGTGAGVEAADDLQEEEEPQKGKHAKDRDRDRDDRRDRGRDSDKKKHRSRSRERKDRRRSKSRSRSRDRKRRSRSRGTRRRRSTSRDRRRSRSRDRTRRSRSRDRKERSRRKSRSRSKGRRRSGSPEDAYGGYVPRPPRQREAISAPAAAPAAPPIANAYGAVPVAPKPQDPLSIAQLLQQQQLQSQQLLLQQQLLSAGAANTAKAQKEARAARRVYIGNLTPLVVTEEQLKAIFNSALMAAFPGSSIPGMEPVVAITRQSEGRYAFIEFRTPEMATAALQLNNQVTLHGKPMTVQRPQDYVDPEKQAQAAQMAQMLMSGMPQAGMGLPGGLPAMGMALQQFPGAPMG